IIDQQFNDGALGDTLLNAGKGIIAYDEWGKGDNARAGGMAAFNVLSAIVGTKGAGSALRGVGAGAQTSRIGAISRAGGAMVRGGELIGRLPTTESLIGKVSQHLPNLRLPDNIPNVNTPHHTDTPNLDAPSVDAPRVDTRNPGSVGDNLADTGRAPDAGAPSIPDAPSAPDLPGPRGGHAPPAGGAVPDAPNTPDAPGTPDTPSGPDGSTPDAPNTPGDRTSDTDTTPGDTTPGNGTPGDGTPGDATPGDGTAGDGTPGDTTPGDPNLGTQPDGSWVGREHGSEFTLTPEQNAAADRFLAGARVDEGQISPQVTSVADHIDGARMQGYPDFVLKGEDSLKRKLATDLAENPDLSLDEAITGLRDSVRYTIEVPPTNYADGVVRAVDDLRARGFENVTWKPTWDVPDSYKGVNSTWRDPTTGRVFELQFHTPESFAAKMATHELYEAQRVPGVPADEVARLRAEQGEIFRRVDVPPGADRLTALGDDLARDRQPAAVGAGSAHVPTGGVEGLDNGHSPTGGDYPSNPDAHGDALGDTNAGSQPGDGTGDGTQATPGGGFPEHSASTDHMPPPEPGHRSLETLPESRVERGADGLIETVDGRPASEYLHDIAEQRAQQFRDGREAEQFSRGEVGEVSSVAFDRRTGELFEGTNGRSREGIAMDDLHPLLRDRLERMETDGPYPANNKDGSVSTNSWPHPHPDNPLSHAEIRAVNELLWRRGGDIGAEVFGDFRVDSQFPFKGETVRSAPCCANCAALLAGTPSNAGRFTGFPPGPHNLLPE
nr:YwqJ-related putative deaminase [Actinomycetota bacterium]